MKLQQTWSTNSNSILKTTVTLMTTTWWTMMGWRRRTSCRSRPWWRTTPLCEWPSLLLAGCSWQSSRMWRDYQCFILLCVWSAEISMYLCLAHSILNGSAIMYLCRANILIFFFVFRVTEPKNTKKARKLDSDTDSEFEAAAPKKVVPVSRATPQGGYSIFN